MQDVFFVSNKKIKIKQIEQAHGTKQ